MKISLSNSRFTSDFTHHLINQDHINSWMDHCEKLDIQSKIKGLFKGDRLNLSEDRQVLHPLLRVFDEAQVDPSLKEIWLEHQAALEQMKSWREKILNKEFLGATGKEIKNIVHIGIGGSDLGPKLVSNVFNAIQKPDLNLHFIANIDPLEWEILCRDLDVEETIFISVSKSFSTLETLENTKYARDLLKQSKIGDEWAKHIFAVSSNIENCEKFGVLKEHILPLNEAIGGRFSVWSTVSFSIILTYGFELFEELLKGAHEMDMHFKTTPLSKNIPVVMALIDDFYRNEKDMRALAVVPYSSQLGYLTGYLQQLFMESNGKSVTNKGEQVSKKTIPVIFGQVGADAQHMFMQALHQGTDIIPTDFIGFGEYDSLLNLNLRAQSQALFEGEKNQAEPHRNFDGGRPSTMIMCRELSAFSLGMLLNCYEHRTFVQSLLWDINAFDQWGVELGKKVARQLQDKL